MHGLRIHSLQEGWNHLVTLTRPLNSVLRELFAVTLSLRRWLRRFTRHEAEMSTACDHCSDHRAFD